MAIVCVLNVLVIICWCPRLLSYMSLSTIPLLKQTLRSSTHLWLVRRRPRTGKPWLLNPAQMPENHWRRTGGGSPTIDCAWHGGVGCQTVHSSALLQRGNMRVHVRLGFCKWKEVVGWGVCGCNDRRHFVLFIMGSNYNVFVDCLDGPENYANCFFFVYYG